MEHFIALIYNWTENNGKKMENFAKIKSFAINILKTEWFMRIMWSDDNFFYSSLKFLVEIENSTSNTEYMYVIYISSAIRDAKHGNWIQCKVF